MVLALTVIVVMPIATEPRLIECPDNTHIWGDSVADCDYDSGVTIGGGGGGGGGRCGGLCGILKGIGGLLG